MVKVPEYIPYPTVKAEDTPTHPIKMDVNPDMFGAAIGRAMSHVGEGFEKMADSFGKIQDMKDEEMVEKVANKNYIDTATEAENFRSKPGDEQTATLPEHLKNLTDIQEDPTKNMTPNQRQKYNAKTQGNTRNQIGKSVGSAVQQGRVALSNEYEGTIKTNTDAIFGHLGQENEQELIDKDISNITEAITKQTALSSKDPKQLEMNVKTKLANSASRVVDVILNKYSDPDRAVKVLNMFKGSITNEAYLIEMGKIYGRIKENTANDEAKKSTLNPEQQVPPGQTKPPEPVKPGVTKPQKKSEIEGPGKYLQLASLQFKGFVGAEPDEATSGGGGATNLASKGNLTIDSRAAAGVRTDLLAPEFRPRLNAAIEAAEKETGSKGRINDAFRDPKRQAQYYANYTGRPVRWDGETYMPHGRGGLAAAPGKSRHQMGMAADLGRGPVLDKLREWAAQGILEKQFGLEFLRGRAGRVDPVHIQLSSALYFKNRQ